MLRSLRARFLVASLLWTAGLLALAHFVSLAILRGSPVVLTQHGLSMIFASVSMAAGFLGVRRGLSPFGSLRTRLAALRAGESRRLEGRYPSEVQPLVDDLNSLLDDRDRMVSRALAKAADLAHGLKTPLAVLLQESDRVERAGHVEVADAIRREVDRMRQQADVHVAEARAVAGTSSGPASASLGQSVGGLCRALSRLHVERGLVFSVAIDPSHAVRCQQRDLDEMAGNLLDNACRFARSAVTVSSAQQDGVVLLRVEDDGRGLPESMWHAVLERGVRADISSSGSGLGLAIVGELAGLYGGSVSLGRSQAGGLQAVLRLPRSHRA
jgi:signal transduction histidine kinase